jgi:hypothetical protein
MEASFIANCGGNLLTVGVVLGIYVLYKRCVHSRCAIHSAWLDCDSPEIKELKLSETRINIKKAMLEHDRETNRTLINGSRI